MTPRSAGSASSRRQPVEVAEHDQEARAGQRKPGRERDDAARGGERGLQRHDDEPDRGKGFDAAGEQRHHHDGTGERQRRQHMRAFVAAGARQEPGRAGWARSARRRPTTSSALGAPRMREIDRKGRKRRQAADQPRRDEGRDGAQRVSASYRADGCSNASRQSRMILRTLTVLALRLCSSKRRAGTPPLSFAHRVRAKLNER